jgi:hypothetical protein
LDYLGAVVAAAEAVLPPLEMLWAARAPRAKVITVGTEGVLQLEVAAAAAALAALAGTVQAEPQELVGRA